MKNELLTYEMIKRHPDTLEGLKALVDILAAFAYHKEPLTTQDLQNMFYIIGIISAKLDTITQLQE